MQTHYDVLGVSWKANDDQIRAAFRRTVKTCHPDLHAGDRAAERRLRQVLASYEVLRKPQKRQVYDRHLKAERQARNQRVGLTAFTGLVCFTAIASLMLWLPKMTQDASAGPQPAAIAMAIADAHEQVQVAFTSHVARTEINSSSHVARTEINSNSKSDRVAATSKASNNQVVAEEAPRPASKPRPAPVRHAEPQRRLAKEWGQVRQSDDPMAIAAFAARHPDASESKLARSKLIGLIETADDVSLLNILGLGDGEIAERAQQRLMRLRAHTKEETKEEAASSDALKERAASFVSARVAGWSSTSVINLAAHTRAYADEVLYNGNLKSRQAVAREKRRQLELWPERSYEVRPDSITARCFANVCRVGGVVDWQTRNAARDASASGMARFDYEVAPARGTFRILSESLSDLKRPRQAASCSTKGGAATATSQKIRELHRDAQRCLQLAGRGATPKLKTALLARAQVLQHTQQEDAHVVSSFDERWVQAALLR